MMEKTVFKQFFNDLFPDLIPKESNQKKPLIKIQKTVNKHSSDNTLDQYRKIKGIEDNECNSNNDNKSNDDNNQQSPFSLPIPSSSQHIVSSSAKSFSNLYPYDPQLKAAISNKSLSPSSSSVAFTIEEWNKYFSSNSSESINKERLLLSLKQGIPSELRGKVWMFISDSFNISHSFSKSFYENLLKEPASLAESLIEKDVPRTFLYKTSDEMLSLTKQKKKLFNVLKAYAVFDKEVSYCQGMNTIAATLLQVIGNEAYCFYTFTTIMYQHNWREFYKNNTPKLFRILTILRTRLKDQLPNLYQYFIDINFEQYLDIIFTHFFLTLFTYNCPLDFSYRVIDLFWVYEEKALFNAIIKVIKIKEEKLIKMQFEELITYLKNDIVFEAVSENDINYIISDADY